MELLWGFADGFWRIWRREKREARLQDARLTVEKNRAASCPSTEIFFHFAPEESQATGTSIIVNYQQSNRGTDNKHH
jgi:hypothetical protein